METNPTPERAFAADERIVIYIFACGQGDTILLSIHGKWALIDCYLPKKGGVRARFFAKIRELGIEHLNLLCLTHPHYDHYHGMGDVIDYFSQEGRGIDKFCDSGTPTKRIIKLIRELGLATESVTGELDLLYDKIYAICTPAAGQSLPRTRLFQANQQSSPPIHGRGFSLVPVGPDSMVVNEVLLTAVSTARMTSNLNERLNHLSVVLGLRVGIGEPPENRFDALLAADTNAPGFEGACAALRDHHEDQEECVFDFVKVAHHGSLDSHHGSTVCTRGKPSASQRLAVICCDGEDDCLPDREVMHYFLKANWTVLPTTRRVRRPNSAVSMIQPETTSRALTLALDTEPDEEPLTTESDDIALIWSPAEGLRYMPTNAAININDLPNYGTAAANRRSEEGSTTQAL